MKPFVVSPTIKFPANAATSTFAFLGTRGSGKTYGAGVFVEQLLDQDVQTVVVDPVGVWYGLRLAPDGKHAGFAIPVFGGIHGDVPLEPTSGELVAQLIVEHRMSCVLDVSDFTEGQQHRFVLDLSREVFRRKKRSPSPLHIVFEEGHEFFPQFVDASSAPMVGATKRLWKIGRNYGIGGTIISQRAAEVNKGALNLSERIVTGQLKAPEDIKRIDGWANSNGVSDDMVAELPRLSKGTLIVWEESGAVRTVFNKKVTFDASKTPDGVEVKSKTLAPIDLDVVRTAMAATIEEAKANDPKALRARVAELEREVARKPTEAWEKAVTKAVEKPVLKPADIKRLETLFDKLARSEETFVGTTAKLVDTLAQRQQALVSELGNVRTLLTKVVHAKDTVTAPRFESTNGTFAPKIDALKGFHPPPPVRTDDSASGERLPEKSVRMLGALKQGEAMGLEKMPFKSVAVIAGVAPTSGTTSNRKGELARRGLITVLGKDVQLTREGRAYPTPETSMPPSNPEALLVYWKGEIGTLKIAHILDVVVRQGPIANEDIAKAVGMENSGTFSNYKGALVQRGLIEKVHGGMYQATEVFRR